jgi:hypothetical protein
VVVGFTGVKRDKDEEFQRLASCYLEDGHVDQQDEAN